MAILSLIGREKELFSSDIAAKEPALKRIVSTSSFLVLGGAGSIGQVVTKEIFKRNPKKLHIIENNLVELVRNIRSSLAYINGDFQTFALDIGSDVFINSDGQYDFVLKLSALNLEKSVGSQFLSQLIDSTEFKKNTHLTEQVRLIFFQRTVKPMACTINSCPTDLSRLKMSEVKKIPLH